MEKYSCYKFKVWLLPLDESYIKKWHYIIYGEACYPYDDGTIESNEWFDHEQEARFAAIGHIRLLENGEG